MARKKVEEKKRIVYNMGDLILCLSNIFTSLNESLDFFGELDTDDKGVVKKDKEGNAKTRGTLDKVVITVKEGFKKNSYGWIETNKNWKCGQTERYELNVSCDYMNRPFCDIVEVILHEMCHLYAIQKGIKDTSNNNIYHNEKFKQIAEAHHLKCSYVDKAGWTVTVLDDFAKKWVDDNVNYSEIRVYKEKPAESESEPKKKQSSRKLVCPTCGLTVRVTKPGVNLMCMDCEEQLLEED